MNWEDKARLRARYNALVLGAGEQGFAGLGGAVDDSDPDGLFLSPRKRRARVLKRKRSADKTERSDLSAMLMPVLRIGTNPVRQSSNTIIGDDTNDGQEPRGVESMAAARTGIDTNSQGTKPGVKIEHVQGPEVIDDEDDDVVGCFIAELGRAAGTREDSFELD